MATSKRTARDETTGFDVTCVIGRVQIGEGEVSPQVAAFMLIGEHGANGCYSFPTEDGGVMHVDVTHEPSGDWKLDESLIGR